MANKDKENKEKNKKFGTLSMLKGISAEVMAGYAIDKILDAIEPKGQAVIQAPPPPKAPDPTTHFNEMMSASNKFTQSIPKADIPQKKGDNLSKYEANAVDKVDLVTPPQIKTDSNGSIDPNTLNEANKVQMNNLNLVSEHEDKKIDVLDKAIQSAVNNDQTVIDSVQATGETLAQNDQKLLDTVKGLTEVTNEQAAYTTNTIAERLDYSTETLMGSFAEMKSALSGGPGGFQLNGLMNNVKSAMEKHLLPILHKQWAQEKIDQSKEMAYKAGKFVRYTAEVLKILQGLLPSKDDIINMFTTKLPDLIGSATDKIKEFFTKDDGLWNNAIKPKIIESMKDFSEAFNNTSVGQRISKFLVDAARGLGSFFVGASTNWFSKIAHISENLKDAGNGLIEWADDQVLATTESGQVTLGKQATKEAIKEFEKTNRSYDRNKKYDKNTPLDEMPTGYEVEIAYIYRFYKMLCYDKQDYTVTPPGGSWLRELPYYKKCEEFGRKAGLTETQVAQLFTKFTDALDDNETIQAIKSQLSEHVGKAPKYAEWDKTVELYSSMREQGLEQDAAINRIFGGNYTVAEIKTKLILIESIFTEVAINFIDTQKDENGNLISDKLVKMLNPETIEQLTSMGENALDASFVANYQKHSTSKNNKYIGRASDSPLASLVDTYVTDSSLYDDEINLYEYVNRDIMILLKDIAQDVKDKIRKGELEDKVYLGISTVDILAIAGTTALSAGVLSVMGKTAKGIGNGANAIKFTSRSAKLLDKAETLEGIGKAAKSAKYLDKAVKAEQRAVKLEGVAEKFLNTSQKLITGKKAIIGAGVIIGSAATLEAVREWKNKYELKQIEDNNKDTFRNFIAAARYLADKSEQTEGAKELKELLETAETELNKKKLDKKKLNGKKGVIKPIFEIIWTEPLAFTEIASLTYHAALGKTIVKKLQAYETNLTGEALASYKDMKALVDSNNLGELAEVTKRYLSNQKGREYVEDENKTARSDTSVSLDSNTNTGTDTSSDISNAEFNKIAQKAVDNYIGDIANSEKFQKYVDSTLGESYKNNDIIASNKLAISDIFTGSESTASDEARKLNEYKSLYKMLEDTKINIKIGQHASIYFTLAASSKLINEKIRLEVNKLMPELAKSDRKFDKEFISEYSKLIELFMLAQTEAVLMFLGYVIHTSKNKVNNKKFEEGIDQALGDIKSQLKERAPEIASVALVTSVQIVCSIVKLSLDAIVPPLGAIVAALLEISLLLKYKIFGISKDSYLMEYSIKYTESLANSLIKNTNAVSISGDSLEFDFNKLLRTSLPILSNYINGGFNGIKIKKSIANKYPPLMVFFGKFEPKLFKSPWNVDEVKKVINFIQPTSSVGQGTHKVKAALPLLVANIIFVQSINWIADNSSDAGSDFDYIFDYTTKGNKILSESEFKETFKKYGLTNKDLSDSYRTYVNTVSKYATTGLNMGDESPEVLNSIISSEAKNDPRLLSLTQDQISGLSSDQKKTLRSSIISSYTDVDDANTLLDRYGLEKLDKGYVGDGKLSTEFIEQQKAITESLSNVGDNTQQSAFLGALQATNLFGTEFINAIVSLMENRLETASNASSKATEPSSKARL
jgi:hypothetical protein